ncbi:MAG: hypothetical protein BGO51_11160 [Rhodospirillales bacterium 69-11]|nr:MAG: hypothetical protein BGO51_11160 [Rhodospirillales bacterium 69-11]
MLAAELAAIRGVDPPRTASGVRDRARDLNLSALCLSGGGIRSAAFSLGVLQALASHRLLERFDYLSTVSGGGYIGSWLQMLIKQRGSVAAGVDALREGGAPGSALHDLRNYTSYLSPESGMLSPDMWTNIILYLRNVFLNFMVFLPILLLAAVAPVFYRTAIWATGSWPLTQYGLMGLAALAVGVSTYWSARGLPNHRLKPGAGTPAENAARDAMPPHMIDMRVVLPFGVWLFLAPVTLAHEGSSGHRGLILAVLYFLALWLAFLAAGVRSATKREAGRAALFVSNSVAWLVATLVSGGLAWGGSYLVDKVPTAQQAATLAVLGPLWLAASNGINSAVFVGLRRDGSLFDMDREWLARVNALKLRLGGVWAVFAFATIGIPDVLLAFVSDAEPPFWFSLLTPLATGPVAAWLGKQVSAQLGPSMSGVRQPWMTSPLVLNALSGLFVLALLATIGFCLQLALGGAQDVLGDFFARRHVAGFEEMAPAPPGAPATHVAWPGHALLIAHFSAAVLIAGGVAWVNWVVNVNRYSMHAIYRNRLTRAFLGSARQEDRKPDPFTNFDPNDAMPLSTLAGATGTRRLFPVINMTLNFNTGNPAAWAERKAMSFTATPLSCGAALLPRPGERFAQPEGVYVPTVGYAGREGQSEPIDTAKGLTLATAMTISGAAVSPNWGYHSSPVTAFLMTLFNARLGAWLPNPATVSGADLSLGRPVRALDPLLGDLLGRAGTASRSIYLSDGGHFENLGLYEMFRRRCRMILIVDAGQDESFSFEDLGNALRKAAIDQQVEVTHLDTTRVRPRASTVTEPPVSGFAVGLVRYPEDSEPTARLIYMKPSLLPGTPLDARAYANLHEDFPHDPTPNQWFSESQFESYRALGQCQAQLLMAHMAGEELEHLFAGAFSAIDPKSP